MSVSRFTSANIDAGGIRQAIGTAAQRTGVDFTYLYAQAKSESGLNPNAKAGNSSAGGLYQFIDQSWLGILKQHGAEHGLGWAADAIKRTSSGRWTVDADQRQAVFALRNQPEASALMAAEYASDNADGLQKTLGRVPNGTDLYFAHFLGLQGARKFLACDPDSCAASQFPTEARANRGIFYTKSGEPRTVGQVYELMGNKLVKAATGSGDAPPPAPMEAPTLQYADAALDGATPASADGPDIAARFAALGQAKMDVLRPTPANAKLAYMMLQSALIG
ncbi:transglycosylase SLT domain-containing protein [Sphingomonas naphthae]|uniref:Transglycosylase SLT domain-containing protein n=1 Tax=Sphingomonas naphthae TaxID=1813468 RepID=A0ABY7TM49_9SPHN|nr:transglycosylase SLT domain-containing protein [Sphingomonas naphthae]WCT74313.1 transglycosylase SLT domain-containing protein [Sphingomonas naphthae]